MSHSKTILSLDGGVPFDFSLVSEEARQRIEKELDFITAQRLSVILDEIGQDRFVHIGGRSWKQMSRYIRGDKPAAEVLQALATETQTSIDWLAKGTLRTAADQRFQRKLLTNLRYTKTSRLRGPRGEPERSALGFAVDLIDSRLAQTDAFVPSPSPSENARDEAVKSAARFVVTAQRPTDAVQSHMVPLPFYSGVHASAGIGIAAPAYADARAVVSFDDRFLREKGAVPDRCNVITARGDSMAPTIPDGSLLVVDHSQTQVGNGYIMVINLGDDLLVKRVRRRIDGLVDLVSDNPAYPPETIGAQMLDQLRVVGRVVYFCRVP